jgi:pimeloyl-ACP methyl ester carboxylesterase
MTVSRRILVGGAVAAAAASAAAAGQARGSYQPNPPPMPISLPRMTRGYAHGPYGQIHYQDGGRGRPLVLIHQAPMSSRQFESVFAPFIASGCRPIAIDCPGFGQSDVTSFVPTIEDWAAAIPPVLDQLGIQIADILGHHTGSLVATEVEQQFPERVRKLVLAGPLPLTDEERANFLDGVQLREIDFEYQADGSHLTNAFASRSRMYREGGSLPDPQLMTRYTVERFVGYGPFWYGHHAAFIYDHNATIVKIRKPTLIITNTGDQIYEHARWAHRMRPDFDYVELEGGGVDIVDQQPRAWVRAIADFLNA